MKIAKRTQIKKRPSPRQSGKTPRWFHHRQTKTNPMPSGLSLGRRPSAATKMRRPPIFFLQLNLIRRISIFQLKGRRRSAPVERRWEERLIHCNQNIRRSL